MRRHFADDTRPISGRSWKALTHSRRLFGSFFFTPYSSPLTKGRETCSVALSPIAAVGPQSCGFVASSRGNLGPRSRNTSMKFVRSEGSKAAQSQTRKMGSNREVRLYPALTERLRDELDAPVVANASATRSAIKRVAEYRST